MVGEESRLCRFNVAPDLISCNVWRMATSARRQISKVRWSAKKQIVQVMLHLDLISCIREGDKGTTTGRQSQLVGEKVDCAGNAAPDLISCIHESDKCTMGQQSQIVGEKAVNGD